MKVFVTLLPALLVFLSACVFSAPDLSGLSVGQRFHFETGFGDKGIKSKAVTFGEQIPLYKEYPDKKEIPLPEPAEGTLLVNDAINKRKSVRSFSERSLTSALLSRLLLSADGLTQVRGGITRRAAPSAGALYPIDIYVAVTHVESIESGLYHFQVKDSSLELLQSGHFGDRLVNAANGQRSVGDSPVTLIITARFDRVTRKYADRGYRYAYIEAGAVCENIYLQAQSLGLGTVVIGAFNDDALNRLLGVDALAEAALLIMPVGWPR
jgi:SagB-type dehydrogenase family enzyme